MGTGAQTWQFDQDICSTNSLAPMKAVMTVCSLDQFTCESDGTCISMEERCDQFPNCEDFSDESSCQLVVLPKTYVQDYAPFTVLDSGLLKKVEVFLKVSQVIMYKGGDVKVSGHPLSECLVFIKNGHEGYLYYQYSLVW